MSAAQPRAGPSRTGGSGPATVVLDQTTIASLRPAKVFKGLADNASVGFANPDPWLSHTSQSITSITFDDTGEKCVTAIGDEAFMLWDARRGKKLKNFYSKKYGISLARFTHRVENLIHASTRLDDHAIRYHSMHDNTYLTYFKGHVGRVRSLHMCPTDDTFLSAGDDATVRLWDLRAKACKAQINDVGGSSVAAFDNSGMVFAVACSQTQTIMLYAVSSMDHSPFHFAQLNDPTLAEISQPPPKPIFTSIAFSSNGNYLLIGTSSDVHYLIDAFDLVLVRRLVGHQGLERDREGQKSTSPRRGASGEEVCFTGDSKWVISGSADGSVLFWDLTPPPGQEKLEAAPAGTRPIDLRSTVRLDHTASQAFGPCRSVRMNPRYAMMAAGGEEFVGLLPGYRVSGSAHAQTMWLPSKDDDHQVPEGW